jgi:hypothetical protein
LLVQRPTPNLEDQTSVFMTPRDRVAQLYPQTLGTHFSRLLRHAWVTVGLLVSNPLARYSTPATACLSPVATDQSVAAKLFVRARHPVETYSKAVPLPPCRRQGRNAATQFLLILDLDTRWGEWLAYRSGCALPPAKGLKNSVCTSKRTQHFTITKINWLTLFKEIIFN